MFVKEEFDEFNNDSVIIVLPFEILVNVGLEGYVIVDPDEIKMPFVVFEVLGIIIELPLIFIKFIFEFDTFILLTFVLFILVVVVLGL